MILWVDGAHSPEENMRRDAALLAAAERDAEPVLRLFAFRPHGITLGAHERPEVALDLERCRADGVPWALRPTGGRAIFHAEEWTYALATPIDDSRWGGSQAEAYGRASRLIVESLVRLGVPAELVRAERRASGASAGACFASTARHEIELEGRKLVGSAQRRTQRGLLQQGSVLLSDGHRRLADYARTPDRPALAARLAASAAHAGPWLGERTGLDDWAEALEPSLDERARRYEGAEGLFLLTLENPRSYTASLTQLER
jgi:lipoate-protein ligase A